MSSQANNTNKFADIGKRLRALRKNIGLNQSEISDKLGFSTPSVISRLEKGERPLTIETLKKLAIFYNADLHWLITGKVSPIVPEVINVLKPFAYSHLSTITQKIQDLEERRRDLIDRQASGEIHTMPLHEIQEELELLHGYYKTVFGFLNEKLPPIAKLEDME